MPCQSVTAERSPNVRCPWSAITRRQELGWPSPVRRHYYDVRGQAHYSLAAKPSLLASPWKDPKPELPWVHGRHDIRSTFDWDRGQGLQAGISSRD